MGRVRSLDRSIIIASEDLFFLNLNFFLTKFVFEANVNK